MTKPEVEEVADLNRSKIHISWERKGKLNEMEE
jgi:hypothetical protein